MMRAATGISASGCRSGEDVESVLDGWKRIKADFRYFIRDDHASIARAEISLPGNRIYIWNNPDSSAGRTVLLDYDLEDLDFTLPGKIYRRRICALDDTLAMPDSDVGIPSGNSHSGSNIYAIIIANEDYGSVIDVPYALNDGAVFREYCLTRLCVPEDQIAYLTNAGAEDINSLYSWLDRASGMFDADTRILLYFSGECVLDKGLGETFLLPVDYLSKGVQSGMGLRDLYGKISRWGVDDALILLDATYGSVCRNGMRLSVFRDGETRPEWLRPDDRIVTVFAAGEDEAALPYPEKRHGIFTYFVLKALQQHPEGISYGDLFDLVSSGVRKCGRGILGRGAVSSGLFFRMGRWCLEGVFPVAGILILLGNISAADDPEPYVEQYCGCSKSQQQPCPDSFRTQSKGKSKYVCAWQAYAIVGDR